MRPMLIRFVLMCSFYQVVMCGIPSAHAELSASQIVIVANSNSRDSVMVAEHYATRRRISFQHIAKLDLPSDETISRADYDHRLVLPLRQMLQQNRIQQSIRVLVSVYGVPLRVSAPHLTTEEERLHRDASDKLEVARSQLEDIERKARDLALQPNSTQFRRQEEKNTFLPTNAT